MYRWRRPANRCHLRSAHLSSAGRKRVKGATGKLPMHSGTNSAREASHCVTHRVARKSIQRISWTPVNAAVPDSPSQDMLELCDDIRDERFGQGKSMFQTVLPQRKSVSVGALPLLGLVTASLFVAIAILLDG